MQRDEQTHAIIGAAMKVHNELGCGFLESVYQDALMVELRKQKIPFLREVKIPVFYCGVELPSYFIADFVCFDNIIVELKALLECSGREKAQVLNYLKATGYKKALLINFGNDRLQYERIANFFKERQYDQQIVADINR